MRREVRTDVVDIESQHVVMESGRAESEDTRSIQPQQARAVYVSVFNILNFNFLTLYCYRVSVYSCTGCYYDVPRS